jgi:hypothetical protein
MNDPVESAHDARRFGSFSIAASVLALLVCVIDLSPGYVNPQAWEFWLSAALGGFAVLLALAGLDARRSCEAPKPSAPLVAITAGLLITLFMLLGGLFVAGYRPH